MTTIIFLVMGPPQASTELDCMCRVLVDHKLFCFQFIVINQSINITGPQQRAEADKPHPSICLHNNGASLFIMGFHLFNQNSR